MHFLHRARADLRDRSSCSASPAAPGRRSPARCRPGSATRRRAAAASRPASDAGDKVVLDRRQAVRHLRRPGPRSSARSPARTRHARGRRDGAGQDAHRAHRRHERRRRCQRRLLGVSSAACRPGRAVGVLDGDPRDVPRVRLRGGRRSRRWAGVQPVGLRSYGKQVVNARDERVVDLGPVRADDVARHARHGPPSRTGR